MFCILCNVHQILDRVLLIAQNDQPSLARQLVLPRVPLPERMDHLPSPRRLHPTDVADVGETVAKVGRGQSRSWPKWVAPGHRRQSNDSELARRTPWPSSIVPISWALDNSASPSPENPFTTSPAFPARTMENSKK